MNPNPVSGIHAGVAPFALRNNTAHLGSLVELIGFEPTTSALQGRRSPN
jgi:hypothetical protein